MNAPFPNFARAERNFDRQEPQDIAVEDWSPVPTRVLTDEAIERFIRDVAESGCYEDEFGNPRVAGSLYHAVARQWVMDSEAMGTTISNVFWQWAKAAAYCAGY
jgi:hypothetical protein